MQASVHLVLCACSESVTFQGINLGVVNIKNTKTICISLTHPPILTYNHINSNDCRRCTCIANTVNGKQIIAECQPGKSVQNTLPIFHNRCGLTHQCAFVFHYFIFLFTEALTVQLLNQINKLTWQKNPQ